MTIRQLLGCLLGIAAQSATGLFAVNSTLAISPMAIQPLYQLTFPVLWALWAQLYQLGIHMPAETQYLCLPCSTAVTASACEWSWSSPAQAVF